MSAVAETTTVPPPRSRFSRIWPAALGVLVAAGTAIGLDDGRDIAAVVTASGLVYVAAAAVRRRSAAWAAFGVTFVLIALAKLMGLDAIAWMLMLAALLVVTGLLRGGGQPTWNLPLQTAAMLVLGGFALLAVRVSPTAGGLLVSAALLAHAGWDVYHHRADRVVAKSLAEFCCVLDVIVAIAVAVVALGT